MRKQDEATNSTSCWNKAQPDEMTFVILGRDRAFAHAVREWADERVRLGLNGPHDSQIVEALECARLIEEAQDEVDRRRGQSMTKRVGGHSAGLVGGVKFKPPKRPV